MENVKKLIANTLGVDISIVTDEKNLKNDLGADSLKFADLFMNFEEQFELDVESISEEELLNVQTVKDIEDLVKKYSK